MPHPGAEQQCSLFEKPAVDWMRNAANANWLQNVRVNNEEMHTADGENLCARVMVSTFGHPISIKAKYNVQILL
jgi:hypothetical protein